MMTADPIAIARTEGPLLDWGGFTYPRLNYSLAMH